MGTILANSNQKQETDSHSKRPLEFWVIKSSLFISFFCFFQDIMCIDWWFFFHEKLYTGMGLLSSFRTIFILYRIHYSRIGDWAFSTFFKTLSSQLLHLVFSLDKEKKVLIKTEHFLAPNCFILVFSLDNEKGHHRNSFTQLFHGIQNPLMECFYKELRHPVLKPAFAIAFHFPFKRLSAGWYRMNPFLLEVLL